MKEIKDKLKEWGSICRISNIMEDPLTYSHSDMLSFAKYYYESKLKNNEVLDLVSKCDCSPLIACEVCGEEKGLDGAFWKNKKKHDC